MGDLGPGQRRRARSLTRAGDEEEEEEEVEEVDEVDVEVSRKWEGCLALKPMRPDDLGFGCQRSSRVDG